MKKQNLAIVLMTWAWVFGGFAEGLATISPEMRVTMRRETFIHQGDGNGLPRNSMEALLRTWGRGAIPESDARFTKDGIAISFHDGTWKGRKVADITWAELRDEPVAAARGAAFATVRVPTWDAIFAAMKGCPGRRIFVDDKDVGPAAIAALARKYGVGAQVIYHTNRPARCREWKRLCPEGKANLVLYGDLVGGMERLAKEDFEGIDRVLLVVKVDAGQHDFVPASPELKKAIAIGHRHGVFVNVFVGGDAGADETVYTRLSELGADAFGTERPEAFFAWLSGPGKNQ